MKKVFAVVCLLALVSGISFAKVSKSEEKYGLGYAQLPAGAAGAAINTVSLRYWKKGQIGIEGMVGYYSYDNSVNGNGLAVKFMKPVKDEQNLTLYWFAMLGLVNGSAGGTSVSGTILGAGLGVEFFLQGLPNLGLGAEIGITNKSGDAYAGVKGTDLSANPVTASLRYYFQ